MDSPSYEEEFFGILTDDGLYLDCVFYRPPGVPDADLRAIRVWVPKVPLSKTSVMTCARHEVSAAGSKGRIAHLVFDLRGTGLSDVKDDKYENDLAGIKLWAEERFGDINVGFYGTPIMAYGSVDMMPVRPGVVFEQYVYPARGMPSPRTIFYLSTYGNFTEYDERLCLHLCQAGYHVIAIDPLRYLLHAGHQNLLKPEDLWSDFAALQQTFLAPPFIIAQPIASGLGLLLAAGPIPVAGVVSVGRAQASFVPSHVFNNSNPHTFFITRYVKRISPRPAVFVLDSRSRKEDTEELATLLKSSGDPKRLEKTRLITPKFLFEMIDWIKESQDAS
jgi:hypothetical protein